MLYRIVCCIAFITLLLVNSTWADEGAVYKTVDKDGKVTYTDDPPQDQKSEKVELKNINTMPSVNHSERRYSETKPEPAPAVPYAIQIISPIDGYQMGPAEKSIEIVVESNQPLKKGHLFQLTVNGQLFGAKNDSGILTLSQVRRGRQQVGAIVMDENGVTLATANPITVNVIRPNPKI